MSIDLTTYYGGLRLRSPVVVGACPVTAKEQTRRALESAGAGAIVLPSLFEEQVVAWHEHEGGKLTQHEKQLLVRTKPFPGNAPCDSAEMYLSMVRSASDSTSIPIIASLNGDSGGNWLLFAEQLQKAGAAAIELNVHHSPPSEYSGPREMEDRIVELASAVGRAVSIPLFMKLGREYTSLPHFSRRLLSGTQGLVLHGRAPDIDICLDTFQIKASWGLTQSGEMTESLGSIMRIHSYCPAMPLAVCGGIGSPGDVIKVLLAGADVAMVTSAVYREGPDVIRTLIDGLMLFLERHHMQSTQDLQAHRPLGFGSEEERRNYVEALSSQLEADQVRADECALHGDRWGHLAALE